MLLVVPPASTPQTYYEDAGFFLAGSMLSSVGTSGTPSLYAVSELPCGYKLRGPLLVRVEWDDGEFIASSDVPRVFGVGDSQVEAVQDFAVSLVERYEVLHEDEGSLVAALQQDLGILSKIMVAP